MVHDGSLSISQAPGGTLTGARVAGMPVGAIVGLFVGCVVGVLVGLLVGCEVGLFVGCGVGTFVGRGVGFFVGFLVGVVGCRVGLGEVAIGVGANVGVRVGDEVGTGTEPVQLEQASSEDCPSDATIGVFWLL